MSDGSSRNKPCACGSGLKTKRCCGLTIPVPCAPEDPHQIARYKSDYRETGEYLHMVMPTRGAVALETMMAISNFGWNKDEYARLGIRRATFLAVPRMPVAQAREKLADAVVRGMEIQPEAKHWVLWIDDDATPQSADILCLLAEMRRNPDIGILSAYCSPKVKNHPGFVPFFGNGENDLRTPGVDFQPDNIVEVPWVGLHCSLMRGEVLTKLELPRFPTNEMGAGEDVGFSHRIREAGYVCAVHAGVLVGHVDTDTGEQFFPSVGASRVKSEAVEMAASSLET